jgi:transposase
MQSLRRQKAALVNRNRVLIQQYQKEHALRLRAEMQLKELQQVQRPTASNSSLPPSANPIGAKPPVVKKPTGRRSGAQIGHVGTSRTLLPVEQVNEVIAHRPLVCRACQKPIASDAPGEVVGRHQVFEIPPVAVTITEHQSLACRCGGCQSVTRGLIPNHIQASVTGARLTAMIGLLSASMKGSRRDVARVLAEALGCPIALGSVLAREAELSAALAGTYQSLVERAAGAKVKYVDETGWKLWGKGRWLFVSADKDQTIFRIDKTHTRPALKALFGVVGGDGSDDKDVLQGVFCSDRAAIYDMLKISQRQLCWAHLKRDFVAAIERGGAGEAAATKMLLICREMFELWHRFIDQQIDRGTLQAQIKPLRSRMNAALEEGAACGQKKTAGLCRSLLKREMALWRFASTPDLEPTNNLAERMLRPAVVWRKKSFGSNSQAGCRYVERMLSVTQTLRQRGQPVMSYLAEAIQAHRKGQPPPAIPPRLTAMTSKTALPAKNEGELRKVA